MDRGAFHRPPRSFPAAVPDERVVIAQPPPLARRGFGSLLQVLLPALGTLGIVAFVVVMPSKLFLIVAGAFVLMTVASVLGTFWAQRRSGKLSARTQRRLYRAHLAERERQLEAIARQQREIDERLYPDPVRLAGLVSHRRYLWERRPTDKDFLSFRLGRAAVPLACPLELALTNDPMTEHEPDLYAQADALVTRFRAVDDLSVVASLVQASVVTVTGERRRVVGVARSILAQAAAFRAPADMRIMAYFEDGHEGDWGWLKWLPHVRSGRAQERRQGLSSPSVLLASDHATLSRLLEEHVQPRLEQLRRIESSAGSDGPSATVDAPDLLLVLDDFHAGSQMARHPLIRELAARGCNLKVRTLCLVCDDAAEPPEAGLRLVVPGTAPALLERTGASGYRIAPIVLDELGAAAAETLAREVAPLRLEERAGTIDLAAEVRLADVLRDSPEGQLCAPIGLSEEGDPLVLDLKQAAEGGMGPHGLIVGATGSGKSELLRTIVASLAASHTPDELCFVFVDFKGGAAFAELAGLPHSAGMITNLQHDASLIDRMQAALFGEQQRRQAILRAAGNLDDVAAYRALRATDPSLPALPHLLLIVDEFGELLANRPEFIDLFLAIGRVGRSLGMHLLLSSQRLEEGRLRGLEGHLRYRICLRTYSAQESKSVLGTADAFLLPPFPGVGYFSVDTDVFQRFKTALVTTPYEDSSGTRDEPLIELFGLGSLGPASESPGARRDDGGRTELDVLVSQLRAEHGSSERVHQVWLDPLPNRKALSAVLEGAPWWEEGVSSGAPDPGLRACVGLLDRPAEQRQDPLVLDLAGVGGHFAIVGAPQTGKSTLLRTVLASLMVTYRPSELRAYALDFGGGLLRAFSGAPHFGGVAGKSDPEVVRATIGQIRALIHEREACFRELGIDSMSEARERGRAGELTPEQAADVLLVIDNWAALIRDYEDLTEALTEIAVAGLHHGVHLIVSAGRWPEIRAAIREAFGTRLELRLNDPMESDFGRKLADAVPTDSPGRGVTPEGLHFQVALPRLDGRDEASGLNEAIGEFSRGLARRWRGAPAAPIRVLPERIARAELPPATGAGVAIGVEELTLAPVTVDLAGGDQHLIVMGDPGSGRTSLLRTFARGLAQQCSPDLARLVVVDFRRGLNDLADLPLACRIVTRPPQVDEVLAELRELTIERLRALDGAEMGWRGPEVYIVVDDYDLIAGLPVNPLAGLGDVIFQGRDAGMHVVLARASGGAARAMVDPVVSRLAESGSPGLLLSGDPHEGPLLRGVRAEPLPPGRARLLRRRGRPVLVQLALDEVSSGTTELDGSPAAEHGSYTMSGVRGSAGAG
ncbi:MAG TPA: type VII secretion protein EccCb [Solirubrobacteraceae bacterium]|nr:type VII secretion protein EccCb [Solirubrobacteraceae bacterium]